MKYLQLTLGIIRIPITIILFLLFWFPCYILGFPMVAIGLLFYNREKDSMPWMFWAWDSYNGTSGIKNGNNENWIIICNNDVINFVIKDGKYIIDPKCLDVCYTYKNMWLFNAFRNPCCNVGRYILGREFPTKPITYWFGQVFKGCGVEVNTSGWTWWNYIVYLPFGTYSLGWKGSPIYLKDQIKPRSHFMFRISPFKNNTLIQETK